MDKLHRLGPRDPRPGLRGVSDSVPGDEDDLYLSLSIIPRVKARAGCEGWTWTGDENEEWQDHCLMFSNIGQTVSYPGCVRKDFYRDSISHIVGRSIFEFMKGRERTSSYTLKEFVCTFRFRGIISIKVLVKILQHSMTCIGPDF